jgi:hypothetical protein
VQEDSRRFPGLPLSRERQRTTGMGQRELACTQRRVRPRDCLRHRFPIINTLSSHNNMKGRRTPLIEDNRRTWPERRHNLICRVSTISSLPKTQTASLGGGFGATRQPSWLHSNCLSLRSMSLNSSPACGRRKRFPCIHPSQLVPEIHHQTSPMSENNPETPWWTCLPPRRVRLHARERPSPAGRMDRQWRQSVCHCGRMDETAHRAGYRGLRQAPRPHASRCQNPPNSPRLANRIGRP